MLVGGTTTVPPPEPPPPPPPQAVAPAAKMITRFLSDFFRTPTNSTKNADDKGRQYALNSMSAGRQASNNFTHPARRQPSHKVGDHLLLFVGIAFLAMRQIYFNGKIPAPLQEGMRDAWICAWAIFAQHENGMNSITPLGRVSHLIRDLNSIGDVTSVVTSRAPNAEGTGIVRGFHRICDSPFEKS